MPTIDELVQELNLVAEYAGLQGTIASSGPKTIVFSGESFEVDVAWAMGNVKRLPDHTSTSQVREALLASHPDRKELAQAPS